MTDRKKLLIFLIISIVIFSLLILYMFKPLINVLLLGIIFSYLFYPLHKFIAKKTGMKRLSSFLVCLLFVAIITVPMILAVNTLTRDVILLSAEITNVDIGGITQPECAEDSRVCNVYRNFVSQKPIKSAIEDTIATASNSIRRYFGNLLLQIPLFLLNVLIILFMMYYLLIDGKSLIQKIKHLIPINDRYKDRFFANSDTFLGGILYGSLFVAAIQGILGGIGFYVVGLGSPILWGFMMFVLAIVPLVGPVFVWLPAGIFLLISSWSAGDMVGVWKAIGLLLYGAFVVSSIDNILRPKVISRYTKIHPLLVFLGVFGGIMVFGMAGLIIGPLILGMFMTILSMYETEYLETSHKK